MPAQLIIPKAEKKQPQDQPPAPKQEKEQQDEPKVIVCHMAPPSEPIVYTYEPPTDDKPQ